MIGQTRLLLRRDRKPRLFLPFCDMQALEVPPPSIFEQTAVNGDPHERYWPAVRRVRLSLTAVVSRRQWKVIAHWHKTGKTRRLRMHGPGFKSDFDAVVWEFVIHTEIPKTMVMMMSLDVCGPMTLRRTVTAGKQRNDGASSGKRGSRQRGKRA